MKRNLAYIFAFLTLAILVSIPGTAWAMSAFKVSSYGGGHQIWFEAENYDKRDPDTDQYYLVAPTPPAGAFGKAMTRAGGAGGMISYSFDISMAAGKGGTWYFWGRVISPNNQSDYLMVEGDPKDPNIPKGPPPYPGGDGTAPLVNDNNRILEATVAGPAWEWILADHSQGHTKTLKDGKNTMYIFHRQGDNSVYWDVFMWADKTDYVPTDDDYKNAKASGLVAVQPLQKLAVTWGSIKK